MASVIVLFPFFFFFFIETDDAGGPLWAAALCAPSKELWKTRSGRFPWLRHGPRAAARPARPHTE
jgi:hypothetical protein